MDVCRWLETLSMSQYTRAFQDATIDGPFLLELREEDLSQVLGITHKLHIRKIMLSREKLRPLTDMERKQKEAQEREEQAEKARQDQGVPDVDTVFSQARNGRTKRVEESLNLGAFTDSGLFVFCCSELFLSLSQQDSPWMPRTNAETPYFLPPVRTATAASWKCCWSVEPTSITRMRRATRRCTSPCPSIPTARWASTSSSMAPTTLSRILMD
jgi:hypothetical protein